MERELRVLGDTIGGLNIGELYASGITPEEVKEGIVEIFRPYFQDVEALKSCAIDYLVPDTVLLIQVLDEAWAKDLFEEILRVHRSAIQRNRQASLQAFYDHLSNINGSFSVSGASTTWPET